MRLPKLPLMLVLLSTLALPLAAAEMPFLHPLFSDNMVLQRGISCPVWGWTTPGAKVTVVIAQHVGTAKAGPDGKWLAHVGPLPVGGPYRLSVIGPERVVLHDVLVGDVWICSGQSNMQWPLYAVDNAEDEVATANYPKMRLFTVPTVTALQPQPLVNGTWSLCTPETIPNFTAVGYFFGRDLHRELGVPIGLINSSWGGTIAETWTSGEALKKSMPDFVPAVEGIEKLASEAAPGAPAPDGNPNVVTVLYNAMIAPLVPFGIKGAIWYQGESNADRAEQYGRLMPTLIRDWRARFEVGEFPFLIVQLANFMEQDTEPKNDPWPNLREAQVLTTKRVPNVGLACIIDIGAAGDIHPRNKQDVGLRLALNALALTYGQDVEYSGPTYSSMKVEGSKVRVKFDHVSGGLVVKGEKLTGFAIAGADGHFVWADAVVDGDTVLVSSPEVPNPTTVRYAWSNNPVCNLYNGAKLPAVPFRTDGPAE
jgi:sialate O-acetylesterase